MNNKKKFFSIRLKLLSVIMLGIIAVLAVTLAINYFFLKDVTNDSFLYYVTKVGPGIAIALVFAIILILYY